MFKFNKKYFLRFLFISILFGFFTLFSIINYSNYVHTDLSSNLFRLHIIANSNSQIDQSLKYSIRNNILNYVKTLSFNSSSKEDTIHFFKTHLNDFKKITDSTIKEYNLNYSSTLLIDNFYFPTKFYGDISLPAGNYSGLKINLGKAKGKNWWCVMFPPLCFNDICSKILPDESNIFLKENLQKENYDLITNKYNKISLKFKFKIIEIIEEAKNNLNIF